MYRQLNKLRDEADQKQAPQRRARAILRQLREAFADGEYLLPEDVTLVLQGNRTVLKRPDLNGQEFTLEGPVFFGGIPLVFLELLTDSGGLHGDPEWWMRRVRRLIGLHGQRQRR